jgi:hypothetical protein
MPSIERLETRTMLAYVGMDFTFGSNGVADADASLLVSALPDGQVLAVGATLAQRLNADGSIDPAFADAGGAQAALGKMNWIPSTAVVSGERLYVAGLVVPRDLSSGTPTNTVFVRAVNVADGAKVDSFGDHGFATIVITSLIPEMPMGALNYPPSPPPPTAGLRSPSPSRPTAGTTAPSRSIAATPAADSVTASAATVKSSWIRATTHASAPSRSIRRAASSYYTKAKPGSTAVSPASFLTARSTTVSVRVVPSTCRAWSPSHLSPG